MAGLLALSACAVAPTPSAPPPVAPASASAVPNSPATAAQAAPAAPVEAATVAQHKSEAVPLDAFGVELQSLQLSASDFLIDLRYRVLDTAKARPLADRAVRPVLVNESTGERYYVPQPPKVGSLRQTTTTKQPLQANRVYFMLFANPKRQLKAGDKVTLYVGDHAVRGLTVLR